MLSVLLQNISHSNCPLHAMTYPVLSQQVVYPCHPLSFQLLSLCSLQQNNLPSSSCMWLTRSWRQGCDEDMVPAQSLCVPYRSLYIPSPRQQRGWDFMFRLCPKSNRHQHYSFPFLFLQGGMSVGLRKVCKGLTVPPDATASFSLSCPVCPQLPLSPWLNHLLCKAFVPWYSPGSAIFLILMEHS